MNAVPGIVPVDHQIAPGASEFHVDHVLSGWIAPEQPLTV